MLAVLCCCGCRSHRTTVRHEATRLERAVQDSTVTRVDSTTRRDSVSLWWLRGALELEVDSVDWHWTWDSAGRVAGVTGRRLVSRRSSTGGATAVAAVQERTDSEARYQRAIQDSVRHEVAEEKHVETKAGSGWSWLEVVLTAVVLALAVAGVLHLRELTERWSKRRR